MIGKLTSKGVIEVSDNKDGFSNNSSSWNLAFDFETEINSKYNAFFSADTYIEDSKCIENVICSTSSIRYDMESRVRHRLWRRGVCLWCFGGRIHLYRHWISGLGDCGIMRYDIIAWEVKCNLIMTSKSIISCLNAYLWYLMMIHRRNCELLIFWLE